ncbi:MAG: isopentenyl-diphosphate Delta-isomerase [Planctomycetota bacterium]
MSDPRKPNIPAADLETVVLVDEFDQEVGVEEKVAAHQNGGWLHRAFSVMIFDGNGRTLLQQRALQKYHFAGRWTNACCGHPRPKELVAQAARRRLLEEMGFETSLEPAFSFVYRAEDPATGLVEHELDHVFIGHYACDPCPDSKEVATWKWVDFDVLMQDLAAKPQVYTPWLPHILRQIAREEVMSR